MTKPVPVPFIIPDNGAQDFATSSVTALLTMPDLITVAEAGLDYQDTIYDALTSRGILPAMPNFMEGKSYQPLRANTDGTALVDTQDIIYNDGGEVVQFKALFPPEGSAVSSFKGYRRITGGYTLAASTSNEGSVRMWAVFSGTADFQINGKTVLAFTSADRNDFTTATFTGVDGAIQEQTSNGGEWIFVVNVLLTYSTLHRARELTASYARYPYEAVSTVFAEGNGYLSLQPDHANLTHTFVSAVEEAPLPSANAQLVIKGGTDFTGALYDAQIQTGSGFNFFAGKQ